MAKRKSKLRKHRFVVGYPSDRECVYGQECDNDPPGSINPLTEDEAKHKLNWLAQKGGVVFELVEVARG